MKRINQLATRLKPPSGQTRSIAIPIPSSAAFLVQPSTSTATFPFKRLSVTSPALVPSSSSSTPARSFSPHVEAVRKELIDELKSKRSAPDRIWSLFIELDRNSATTSLPIISLHAIISRLYSPPPKDTPLTVTYSTYQAAIYAQNVDLVMLRLQQAGGSIGVKDYEHQMKQYLSLAYAPGAYKVYQTLGELLSAQGKPISSRSTIVLFETMAKWVKLHHASGGPPLAQTAAEPLVAALVAVFDQLDAETIPESLLENFFQILVHARALDVFAVALKGVYGYDIYCPGADVDAPAHVRAKRRTIGPHQAQWTVEMLAAHDNLSLLMANFETFDSEDNPTLGGPSSPSSSSSTSTVPFSLLSSFFGPSFSISSPFSPPTSSDTSTTTNYISNLDHATPSIPLVGPSSYNTMIEAAARHERGSLIRHYLSELCIRWERSYHYYLTDLENKVGVVWEPKGLDDESSEGLHPIDQTETFDSLSLPDPSIDSLASSLDNLSVSNPSILPPDTSSADSLHSASTDSLQSVTLSTVLNSPTSNEGRRRKSPFLFRQPISGVDSTPYVRYKVSPLLVDTLGRMSKTYYDAATSQHLYMTARMIIRINKTHLQRMQTVINAHRSTLAPVVEGTATDDPTLRKWYRHRSSLEKNHESHLEVYKRLKVDNKVVRTNRAVYRASYLLRNARERLELAQKSGDKASILRRKSYVHRRELEDRVARREYYNAKLRRLKFLDKAYPGRHEFDIWFPRFMALREEENRQWASETWKEQYWVRGTEENDVQSESETRP